MLFQLLLLNHSSQGTTGNTSIPDHMLARFESSRTIFLHLRVTEFSGSVVVRAPPVLAGRELIASRSFTVTFNFRLHWIVEFERVPLCHLLE
jgi:hypothetical protein